MYSKMRCNGFNLAKFMGSCIIVVPMVAFVLKLSRKGIRKGFLSVSASKVNWKLSGKVSKIPENWWADLYKQINGVSHFPPIFIFKFLHSFKKYTSNTFNSG